MYNRKPSERRILRLCVYLRELAELSEFNINTVSSVELGRRTNLSDAQVRKDLAYFGNFGVSGSGYNTHDLKAALEKILGKDKIWNLAVVGVGHLGSALLSYPGFKQQGFTIVAAFDTNIKKIGKKIQNIIISSIEKMPKEVAKKNVSIGIIAVPAKEAQAVADKLINSGVKCILNFAPTALNVPEDVNIKDVDFSRELETLLYFLAKNNPV